MKRIGFLATVVVALAMAPAAAHAWGRHYGYGPHVFFGVYGPPAYYPYPAYPYYPYPYAYPAYPYPYPYPPSSYPAPPPTPSEEPSQAPSAESDDADASYGLVQLRGVPDGADVDLDGRFWLRAQRLDDRWLALPEGAHSVRVHIAGEAPVERSIQVARGKNLVIRVVPTSRPHA